MYKISYFIKGENKGLNSSEMPHQAEYVNMPSLTEEAQKSLTATNTGDKEYESLTTGSGEREVLQVPTVFSKCAIRTMFMFGFNI